MVCTTPLTMRDVAAVAGAMLRPLMVTISPGATPRGWPVAALVMVMPVGTAGAVTVRVTLTATDAFDAPAALMVITPWYVPGARPCWLTATRSVAGVVPEAGCTVSQFAVLTVLEAVAVNVSGVPLLVTEMVCSAGAGMP